MESYSIYCVVSDIFYSVYFSDSFTFLWIGILFLFIANYQSVVCIYTTICLSVHLLRLFSVWNYYIQSYFWTFMCTILCRHVSSSLEKVHWSGIAESYGKCAHNFIFGINWDSFSVYHIIIFLPAMSEGSIRHCGHPVEVIVVYHW